MVFRPHIVLTALTVCTLGFLLWLGYWQLQRAEWKTGLIAEFNDRAAQAPVSWDDGVCAVLTSAGTQTIPPMTPETVNPQIGNHSPETGALRIFGRSPTGQVGWRILAPTTLGACGLPDTVLLAQNGFEPEQVGPIPPMPETTDLRYHLAPWPDRPAMAAANNPEANQWYWFDADRIEANLPGHTLRRDFILIPVAGMPDHLTRTPPIRHISYAVTWFGLAICLIIVYAILQIRAGRLSLRSKPDQSE